jgi:hypothetical protein
MVVAGFSAIAVLGVLTTTLFYFIGAPHFPVFTMLAMSVGFVFCASLYVGVIRVLSY